MRRTPRALARLTSCPLPGDPGQRRWWQTICWPQVAMMVLLIVFAFGPILAAGAAATTTAPAPLAPGAHGSLVTAPVTPGSPRATLVPSAVDDSAPLDLEVLSQSAPTLQAGEQIAFQLRVTNVSPSGIAATTVDLLAQEWTPSTRIATARWADENRYSATLAVAQYQVGPLAPGQSTEFTLTASADAFAVTGWGPRGVELRATPTDPAGTPDRERTWVTFWDGEELSPTPLTVISPLTASFAEWSDPAALAARTAALLGQAQIPGVALAVDPSLLDLLPDDAREDAAAALPGLDVWSLPWSDADTRALVGAGRTDLIDVAVARSAEDLAALGVTVSGPLDLDAGTDSRLFAQATGATVLSSTRLPDWLEGTYTPGALVQVGITGSDWSPSAGRGEPTADESAGWDASDWVPTTPTGQAVVADAVLADALDGTLTVDDEDYTVAPASVEAYAVAQTAAFARERPSMPRALAIVLPREDDGALAATLATLASQPWIEPTPLADLLDTDPRYYGPDVIPTPVASPIGAVSEDELESADEARSYVELASELSAEYGAGAALAQLDRVAARAWREDPAGREAAIAEASGTAQDLLAAVYVEPPSNINMLSGSSNIPVTVTNTADLPLTVQIVMRAPDTHLRQTDPAQVEVPADGHVTHQVPVTAIGSGDLTVQVGLETTSGQPIGETVPIEVRLLIQWENAMLIALIAVGVVAFVLGIVRTARRNARTHRAREIEAAGAELDKLMSEEDA